MSTRKRIGILELITNKTDDAWFETNVMLPNFASIMPQAIGAWAEEMGCEVFYETYTGSESLEQRLPADLDLLFISAFSRGAFLAYAISNLYRKRGVVTVLGGPHARSFAAHASHYFDYVCQLTDEATIRDLVRGAERQQPAVVLNAKRQPLKLPNVAARARFIDHNIAKNRARRFVRTVPMISSMGCPYTCNFCIDAPISYQTLPETDLVADLRYIEKRWGVDTLVFWHDPNYGVRFDASMALIESSGTQLLHGGESSLSLLTTPHLKAMKKNRWVAQVPGIESWYGFTNKGGAGSSAGLEKVRAVAEHVNEILEYIPYLQTNFVLGLDTDAGNEPFELTKRFLELAPGAFPGYSIVTDFQNAPLSAQLAAEGRTFLMPHALLDNNFAFNVRIKNYPLLDFYAHLIDLQAHSWGARAVARRVGATKSRYAKVANIARSLTEGRWRLSHFARMRKLFTSDPSFLAHYNGERAAPPQFYFDHVNQMLGSWAQHLPVELSHPTGFVESVARAASLPLETSADPQPKPEPLRAATG